MMNPNQTSVATEWIARSRRAVWHPCTQMKHHEQLPLVPLARGAGAWLYDVDGQRYLDAISSWWVNLFGHANTFINDALKAQLDTLEHAMLAGCTHAPAIELAERLSALTGGTLGHAFFASDGASAVEIALKMSFHYWRNSGLTSKQEFVCVANGYHGETIGALGVTDVALFKTAYDPLLRHAHIAPSPDARQAQPGESAADVAQRSIAAITELFEARHTQIAAIIIEPLVQCAAGMAMHDPSFITKLRALCDRYAVHLITDEIAVGCGRTGTFFAYEQAGIQPDFLCLSKGISGGYLPLSVVLTRDAIYAAFYADDTARGFLHSHSYTGNPLACRAALATLDLFEKEDVLMRNRAKSERLAQLLEPLTAHPQVRHLRRCGTIIAFDVTPETITPKQTPDKNSPKTPTPATSFSRRFFETALRNELLLRPIHRTVYLMPPYILSNDEITLLAERTCATLEQVLSEFF
ncbi:adenosylmethionine-8-amino-7-oxononanoate aminotransferase protein [Mycoavidus cysteinexigens]|uniref:Adenosylmethionine-8-amino-7-oxononanoate aminotransferase n=1 Tax=Mycoavidus cysteinexigens TaxID=1553431 RepID=A0A2Z6ES39_9BURK|nr:adenosylmethionine--8-amino-7-oxononanoate transaminase [Mycoavidus cysteinexigens]BBE08212.1 adenosylmethionine-8-amino-7-oxononanoate aminotransferase protein [Mycoavidus cysteinexigens]GAM53082.1 adenosylmethionine-8-amino-7-oxononanoate aminotransferase [bacterium endosymbiont of Mortierella elongata FMR23-6]GLR02006.1 adenosylmethionine--8-amino-7-oxononanoate aminotransferase BioA [Mycoavidus cysteinexigens]